MSSSSEVHGGMQAEHTPPLNLADRYLIPVTPPTDHTQQLHVDHSDNPNHSARDVNRHGSNLSENSDPLRVRSQRTSTILYHLSSGSKRFGDLKRLVVGISEKVLIQ